MVVNKNAPTNREGIILIRNLKLLIAIQHFHIICTLECCWFSNQFMAHTSNHLLPEFNPV